VRGSLRRPRLAATMAPEVRVRRIAVLGCGRVGSAIARDLAEEFEVTVADRDEEALDRVARGAPVRGEVADLADPGEVRRLAQAADLVVGAVPGDMGFATLKAVLEVGRPVVDISFFDQDPFLLDELARDAGVTAVVDCGVAPGLSNLVLGREEATMDRVTRFLCYVGGLPVVRTWPYEYKAVFSPLDVIEEYTRPARYVAGGEVVTAPALSDVELIEVPGLGTLEAFNTDGLRTLLVTVDVPEMREKTLRYPGHAERMRLLRETGLFGKEPLLVNGVPVRPVDLTAELLLHHWRLRPGDEDLTVMRLVIEGVEDGRHVRRTYEMLDRYDRELGITSMARTTGYTCTAAVRAVAHGAYRRVGISPPEFLGREPACHELIVRHLAERGIHLAERTEPAG